eukprot:TRINITY_DN13289_c0_g1_i1.p1 TRINITY_DN13289_c0_g1~~TRINITY_DN13289_c0_g1_i1.p1  ORF type:complete len:250 (+),score=51.52 TRINITY_DN13289_c0_g1_i1:64-750(+)
MVIKVAVTRNGLNKEETDAVNALLTRRIGEVGLVVDPERTFDQFDVLLVGDREVKLSPKILLGLVYGAPLVTMSWVTAVLQHGASNTDHWAHLNPKWQSPCLCYSSYIKPLHELQVHIPLTTPLVPLLSHIIRCAGGTVHPTPTPATLVITANPIPDTTLPQVTTMWLYHSVVAAKQLPYDSYLLPGCVKKAEKTPEKPKPKTPRPPSPNSEDSIPAKRRKKRRRMLQ